MNTPNLMSKAALWFCVTYFVYHVTAEMQKNNNRDGRSYGSTGSARPHAHACTSAPAGGRTFPGFCRRHKRACSSLTVLDGAPCAWRSGAPGGLSSANGGGRMPKKRGDAAKQSPRTRAGFSLALNPVIRSALLAPPSRTHK